MRPPKTAERILRERYGFRVLFKTNEQEDKDESKQKYFFIGRKTASPGIQRPPFPHGLQRKGSIPGALQRTYSVLTKDVNLYGSKLIKIPEPHFVVFYNGIEPLPEHSVLQLADAFSRKNGKPKLNLEVLVLNINAGYNQELMEHCRTLREYMIYVDTVRAYAKEMPFQEAVDRAISECISTGILADFLSRNQAEVKKVSIYEYDEEKHIRQEREDAMQKGEFFKLATLVLKKYTKGLTPEETADILEEDPSLIEKIYALKQSFPDLTAEELTDKLLE